MSEINREKKFFRLPKPVDKTSEEELHESARFILESILGEDDGGSDE
jgi:hypothetical protein